MLKRAIQGLLSLLGIRSLDDRNRDSDAHWFVDRGCDYYVVARYSIDAQRWVSGNLFHHAVEMMLKSGLRKKGKRLEELRRAGHRLTRLWRMYKSEYPDGALRRHDKTIKTLDRFEEIRYPNPDLASIGMSIGWSGPPGEIKTFGGLKTPRQYAAVADQIDELVADILRTSSWNPGVVMRLNQVALEAVTRENKQAGYLTTVIPAGRGEP